MLDLAALSTALDTHDAVVRIVLAEVRGSTPRRAGTDMLVWADGASGTIGGGRLEWEAMAAARDMLMSDGPAVQLHTFALGPELNQCCGGAVTAVLELWDNARYRALHLWTKRLEVCFIDTYDKWHWRVCVIANC